MLAVKGLVSSPEQACHLVLEQLLEQAHDDDALLVVRVDGPPRTALERVVRSVVWPPSRGAGWPLRVLVFCRPWS